MNMITRTVIKRAVTHTSAAKDRPNAVSLRSEPWHQPEPERPEHPRPADGPHYRMAPPKIEAASVAVARPRATSSKCVPASEEEYAIRWAALCRKEGHRQCLPISAQARRECPAFDAYLKAALAHLLHGEDNRAGLAEAIGVTDGQTVADIVRDLRSEDYLLTYKRGRFTMMSLSLLGEKAARA
jgi:hypothetical protein